MFTMRIFTLKDSCYSERFYSEGCYSYSDICYNKGALLQWRPFNEGSYSVSCYSESF